MVVMAAITGLRDIFEKVGYTKILRLRIGVGHPGSKEMVSSWVLNKFHPTDKKYVDMAYDKLCLCFRYDL
jgi:PTH1 family peptidyl-tRNA hydrolase